MNEITNLFSEIAKMLWNTVTELVSTLWPMIRVSIMFLLWVLAACIILPCVLISGSLYPLWEKWGEQF